MKFRIQPVSWLFAGLGVLGLILQRPEMMVLGFGGFAVMVLAGGFKLASQNRNSNPLDQVKNENRSRLMPLVKLNGEINEIIESNKDNGLVRVMGTEAQQECNNLMEQSIKLLNTRDQLKNAVNGSVNVEDTITRLRANVESATTQPEREMLESGIQAHESQLAQIEMAREAIDGIDANLSQAVALLSELRTRLALAATSGSEGEQETMRETLSQLHALTNSFDEAEQVFGVKS